MYTEKYEVLVARAIDLNSLADAGNWAPLTPHIIRRVALAIGNDIAAAGEVRFDKRVTFGSDVGRGDGDVAIIVLGTAHTGGKVVYKDNLNVRVNPGEQVMVQVTDVTGASDVADVILEVEKLPIGDPANYSAMVATA